MTDFDDGVCFRVMVQIARGTPHGRDRERWGFTRDGRGGRRLSPDRERFEPRGPTMGGGPSKRASWLEKYGPPERTDYREGECETTTNYN